MINLNFTVTNLGVVRTGEFNQKPLTIFCGPNNSGKTWVMYSLYHCHKKLKAFAKKRKSAEKSEQWGLQKFNNGISEMLGDLFNARDDLLHDAKFYLQMEPEQFGKLLDDAESMNDPFLMPAERNGLHLFYRELSSRRTALLHHASKENINLNELLRDVIRSRYAIPIADYIDWLNQLSDMQRSAAGYFHETAKELQRKLAGGAYSVDKSSGNIAFKPYQKRRDGVPTDSMGLHMTSSTVKSLFGLWFYLENRAKPGDLLMIDEPELNIHPQNQRAIARVLAKLVNAGIHIVISTHSDYMVREFNSLLMLSQDSGELREKHSYSEEEILTADQVSACLFDEQTITPFEITSEDGIYATTFDEVIKDLNEVNDDIYYSLQEKHLESGDD